MLKNSFQCPYGLRPRRGVVDRREERSDLAIFFSSVKTRLLRGETVRKDSSTGFFNILLEEQRVVLEQLKGGNGKYYHLLEAVIMPDHVHLLLVPYEKHTLSEVMKGIKGVSARKINLQRKTSGRIWQDESYDRIVRNEDESNKEFDYILNNPVKTGLTEDGWSDPGWYYGGEE